MCNTFKLLMLTLNDFVRAEPLVRIELAREQFQRRRRAAQQWRPAQFGHPAFERIPQRIAHARSIASSGQRSASG